MSNIINFPVTPTKGPGRASAFVQPDFLTRAEIHQRCRKFEDFNTKTAPARTAGKQFRADLYLMEDGKAVAFTLLFPMGVIGRDLVAAMLRRAALEIDPSNLMP